MNKFCVYFDSLSEDIPEIFVNRKIKSIKFEPMFFYDKNYKKVYKKVIDKEHFLLFAEKLFKLINYKEKFIYNFCGAEIKFENTQKLYNGLLLLKIVILNCSKYSSKYPQYFNLEKDSEYIRDVYYQLFNTFENSSFLNYKLKPYEFYYDDSEYF